MTKELECRGLPCSEPARKKSLDEIAEGQIKGATVIMITSDGLGRGNEELGKILMKSYFYALVEGEDIPADILFVNAGVKLTSEGSEVLDHLAALEKKGAQILSCGTCLDFFNLKESLRVGQITNMYIINEKIMKASRVINI